MKVNGQLHAPAVLLLRFQGLRFNRKVKTAGNDMRVRSRIK